MLDYGQIKIGFPTRSQRPCRYRDYALFPLLFFLFTFFANAQVTSSIDSTNIKIGEEIQYSIQVNADSTDVVVFPEGQTFLPLEVIQSYKVDTTFENTKYRLIKRYGLTQFDSGAYTIPSQKVFINEKQYATDSVNVEVRDVAVDTTKQKMFDIKPAIEVKEPPFDYIKLLYWIIPILIIIGILIFIFFRRKKIKEAREVQLPPYEEALVALKNLDSSPLLRENKSKEYYSSLTEIVKRYLDREVDETALESTSDVLIARLQLHKDAGHFDFDAETIKDLDQVLKRADLVKFAKMTQEQGQAESDRRTIEEIINETHEVIPEPTEEELQENEEYLAQLEKKKKRKQWMLGIAGLFSLLILAGVVYGSINGFDNLKDAVLGNSIRELSEKKWIKSEYGNPMVVIETPEVLTRVPLKDSPATNISTKDIFTYGNMNEELYILVSTQKFAQPQEPNLDDMMEKALSDLEKGGAKNMIVKQEDFETQKGIKGKKAYGDFNVQVSDKEINKETSKYELLLFAQKEGFQQIIIVYKDDGRFAEDIKERITSSVELEISEN